MNDDNDRQRETETMDEGSMNGGIVGLLIGTAVSVLAFFPAFALTGERGLVAFFALPPAIGLSLGTAWALRRSR